MEASKSFRDLKVWQNATDFTVQIYKVTTAFPKEEIFGLTSQMRRAAVSIGSNIAEGFGRKSYREKDNFYSIAYGSLLEVESQVIIAYRIGYFSNEVYDYLDKEIAALRKMLNGLMKVNKTKGERI